MLFDLLTSKPSMGLPNRKTLFVVTFFYCLPTFVWYLRTDAFAENLEISPNVEFITEFIKLDCSFTESNIDVVNLNDILEDRNHSNQNIDCREDWIINGTRVPICELTDVDCSRPHIIYITTDRSKKINNIFFVDYQMNFIDIPPISIFDYLKSNLYPFPYRIDLCFFVEYFECKYGE